VAVVAITVGVLAVPSLRAKLGFPAHATSYAVGERVDVPAALYQGSSPTLLVFARNSCSACQRGKAGFARVTYELRRHPANVVVVTSQAHRDDEIPYARDLGLDESHVIGLDLSGLRLKVVPTLVLVDDEGQVRFTSEGVISPTQEQDLLRAAASLAPPR
jgi:hypothetical protein